MYLVCVMDLYVMRPAAQHARLADWFVGVRVAERSSFNQGTSRIPCLSLSFIGEWHELSPAMPLAITVGCQPFVIGIALGGMHTYSTGQGVLNCHRLLLV